MICAYAASATTVPEFLRPCKMNACAPGPTWNDVCVVSCNGSPLSEFLCTSRSRCDCADAVPSPVIPNSINAEVAAVSVSALTVALDDRYIVPVVGNVTEHVTTGSKAPLVVVHCVDCVTAPHVRLAADSPCGRGTEADDEDGSIKPAARIDDATRAVTAIRRQRTIRPTCPDSIAEPYQGTDIARVELVIHSTRSSVASG